MGHKGTVFVGMSGGVDSSVAAYLLKQEGYDVVGVFIKVWQPDFLRCHWEDERLDAMRVAAHLEIPFLTCDAEEVYRRDVADYFIEAYRRGDTPNPDVMCNTHVKFGAFHRFAKERGADHIATGHYARLMSVDGKPLLLSAVDQTKDQTYFLWNAPEEALADTIFPLGGLHKDEVRAIARKAGIPTAAKRDSQGICFLGQVDVREFLAHYMTLVPGKVLDTDGSVVGTHSGALIYTLGQRHGFTVSEGKDAPHYVIARDLEANTITISSERPEHTAGEELELRSLRQFRTLEAGERLRAQTRYHGPVVPVEVISIKGDAATVRPLMPLEEPAPGQSVVLLDDGAIVAGAVVSRA
jgi:tRNA-uridine 2-sulfurtransferase